jgi:hypothetical protein
MKKNVGFDFDGVIHKDVGLPDINGQRHPNISFNDIPKNKFTEIIDLIQIYKKNNYNIYIITSRLNKHKNVIKQTLESYGLQQFIPENNIICTGDIGGDKINILKKLKIKDFYDDSISHIKSIIKNKKYLSDLKNCYITFPEKNKIYKII